MPYKDIKIMVNDLGVYFRGLQVAVGSKHVDDMIQYLNNMKKEIDYSLELLGPIRKELDEKGVQRASIEKTLADYRSKVHELKGELKKL